MTLNHSPQPSIPTPNALWRRQAIGFIGLLHDLILPGVILEIQIPCIIPQLADTASNAVQKPSHAFIPAAESIHLENALDSPAGAQTGAHDFVQLIDADDALVDEMARLAEQDEAEAVGDEALGLLVDDDGAVATAEGEEVVLCEVDLGGQRGRRRDELEQRHDVRRVEGMHDEQTPARAGRQFRICIIPRGAGPVLKPFQLATGADPTGRAPQATVGRDGAHDGAPRVALERLALRALLLHDGRADQRLVQSCADAQASLAPQLVHRQRRRQIQRQDRRDVLLEIRPRVVHRQLRRAECQVQREERDPDRPQPDQADLLVAEG